MNSLFLLLAFVGSLPGSALHPYGRSMPADSGAVELIGSAAHFGVGFTGPRCVVYVHLADSSSHNYLQYEMDGVYQGRVRIEGRNRRPLVIKTGSTGHHTVWIYKATEATSGPFFIARVTGLGIVALERPEAPLIEFIGNSITCGAQADASETPCGVGEYIDHHNGYYAYGPRVSQCSRMGVRGIRAWKIMRYSRRSWSRSSGGCWRSERAEFPDEGRARF
jgi:hypothetical protein